MRRSWHRFVLGNDQWKKVIQAYLACISFADAQIGRLLDGLESSAYKENTIIVLWSDHGMHIGEKENWEKFTLWEESTRVPFFIKVPGITKAGSVCRQPVSLLDIYPTLTEIMGFQIPEHCDGVSLLPQLKDPELSNGRKAMTSYRFPGGMEAYSLRGENFRYICYPEIRFEELYDHRIDPGEYENIAYKDVSQAIIEQFRNELIGRVEGLSLTEMAKGPVGYTINNGEVLKNDYKKLEELPFIDKHFPLNIWQ